MGFSANSCSLLPLALKRSLSLAAFCIGVCSVLVFLCSGEEVLGKLSARSHRAMDTICHKLLWMGGGGIGRVRHSSWTRLVANLVPLFAVELCAGG